MGYYINQNSKGTSLPARGKVQLLVEDGAKIISNPTEWKENIVCVVHNGPFEAAGFMHSIAEFEAFNDKRDLRPKTWLIYPHAKKLSGYGE